MKKSFILLLAIPFLLLSCERTKEDKAKEIVKTYLSKNLKDASSYESVEFGALDSIYSTAKMEKEYIKIDSLIDNYKAGLRVIEASIRLSEFDKSYNKEELDVRWKSMSDSIHFMEIENLNYIKDYNPYFNGYKMTHKYRAKNGLGALDITTSTFIFDKDLNEVVIVK